MSDRALAERLVRAGAAGGRGAAIPEDGGHGAGTTAVVDERHGAAPWRG